MKTFSRLFVLFTLCILSFTGCKKGISKSLAQSQASKQTLRINIASEPQSLDPRKARNLNDVNTVKMFMEGLTRIDQDGNPTLALAEKVHVSDDAKTYTFTLRESKWSNGDLITAHDFVYTLKQALSPTFNAPNANMLYVIKNAQEVKKGKLPLSLLGVEAIDNKTLTINLNHPIPYFLDLIAHPIFFPINMKVDKLDHHWAEKVDTYVTSGPFSMKDWKHHNVIEATKSNQYWDQKIVKLNHIKMIMVNENTGFKMFETNELDWDGSPFSKIPPDAIQILKSKQILQTIPVLATSLIRINVSVPPFNSEKMRKAFGLAINRKDLVDYVTQGNQIPATGLVPKAMGLQSEPYFKDGDIKQAQEFFGEALAENGMTKEELPEITLTYGNTDQLHPIAQAIQQQWLEAFDIHVRLEPSESKILFDRMGKQNYTLAMGSWFADFNDPINFLEVFKTKKVGTNNTNWENPCYTELLDTSYSCKNVEERQEILKQSEQLIVDEMPIIPLYYYTLLYVKDDQLKDVVLTEMGSVDFKWAYID